MAPERASLLTIPCELRNAIYMLVFAPAPGAIHPPLASPEERGQESALSSSPRHLPHRTPAPLDVLRTCKQIHREAHLLALSMTPFHISGDCSYPDLFGRRSQPLSAAKMGAIRHLTLTARIIHLRALTEAWAGLPFGHPALHLDHLTIMPRRPEVHAASLAELADLSQSHTLAYICCETLKGLRHVKCVEVRNAGCFNEVVWRLFYRNLVYRLWRWGGATCGVRFVTGETMPGGTEVEANRWFRAYFSSLSSPSSSSSSSSSSTSSTMHVEGTECGAEVVRLLGVTGEAPLAQLTEVGS